MPAIKEKIRLGEQATVGGAEHRYLWGAIQGGQRLADAFQADKIGWTAPAQLGVAQDIRHIQQRVSSIWVIYQHLGH